MAVLEADDVDFEDVSGGDDEVGERGVVAGTWGPVGVEVVVGWRNDGLRSEVGAGMGEEAGGAVFDAGGPLHHLVCGETHGGERNGRFSSPSEVKP